MIDKKDIIEYINETYNNGITTYKLSDFVRVTNGSAGFYADFHMDSGIMEVTGRRYSDNIHGVYEPTEAHLEKALSEQLGL